ncbi:MAG TPA: DUF2934 domain-containing protein [Burkholderiales bacterium]|jgi:hypothetical protein|nr:DUF2934 domain-containing protein [Burkholderiales bacterium]
MQSQSQGGPQPAPSEEALSRKAAPVTAPANDAEVPRGAQNDVPAGASPVTPHDSPQERHARIAAEAYRIAEENGFPPNMGIDHWYEAQRRLGYAGLNLADANIGSTSERM